MTTPDTPSVLPTRKSAIVTGGSRGIGRAVVEALAENGWQVAFCGHDPERTAQAQAELQSRFGPRISGAPVDVRNPEAVDTFVAKVLAEHGRIDLLVNNAGVGRFAPIDEISGEAWRETIETNLSGPFYFLHAVAPAMKRAGSGWIINIASLAGRHAFAGGAAYNASKFGLVALSEAAMLDLRPFGVRVGTILPGSVETDFGHPAGRGTDHPTGWRLAPEDVAAAVLHLLSYPERALPSTIEIRPTKTGKG
ncbi:MAG TPA: SDR family oxidoreductase [Thermoanaerobaculia bacterium]|jgi:NAD(P)-dependent dehydrogenase (short-subunit alcohol dehydrogenase family)|nr:SDR family oxidoreductase [Thermoanaerobaculia bacterium]